RSPEGTPPTPCRDGTYASLEPKAEGRRLSCGARAKHLRRRLSAHRRAGDAPPIPSRRTSKAVPRKTVLCDEVLHGGQLYSRHIRAPPAYLPALRRVPPPNLAHDRRVGGPCPLDGSEPARLNSLPRDSVLPHPPWHSATPWAPPRRRPRSRSDLLRPQ